MEKIRIGILGTSEVAFRRFLPALKKSSKFVYVGVASRSIHKTQNFVDVHGGKGLSGYDALLKSDEVDALYIPLPPALHYLWAKRALEHGKHVLLEKPFTTNLTNTETLIELARKQNLALHENYMFIYHHQLAKIMQMLADDIIGDVRLVRTAFGFPFRGLQDFRYSKDLGGGALFDCGGYPIRLASFLLGDSARVLTAHLGYVDGIDVDIFGSATLENDAGVVVQMAFGMDNSYKCELEIWGSEGCLMATRIFTAPADYSLEVILTRDNGVERIQIANDDQFLNSINAFYAGISDRDVAKQSYEDILQQGRLVAEIQKRGST